MEKTQSTSSNGEIQLTETIKEADMTKIFSGR